MKNERVRREIEHIRRGMSVELEAELDRYPTLRKWLQSAYYGSDRSNTALELYLEAVPQAEQIVKDYICRKTHKMRLPSITNPKTPTT